MLSRLSVLLARAMAVLGSALDSASAVMVASCMRLGVQMLTVVWVVLLLELLMLLLLLANCAGEDLLRGRAAKRV